VVDISPLAVPNPRLRHLGFLAARRAGRSYRYELDTGALRAFARQVRERLAAVKVDAAVSMGVLPAAGGTGGLPMATWSDATVENLAATYREYQRIPRWQSRNAVQAELAAVRQVDVLGFASRWAADSAVRTFGADPGRVVIAPFGASLVPPPTWRLEEVLARRRGRPLTLVWIGADWERKRADFCLAVAAELEAAGREVELVLVGALPPSGNRLPAYVRHLGFVDKSLPDGGARLTEVLDRAHVLLLPSRAECFGIAVAEGNAHAVPCFGSRVGGLADAIQEGVNGFRFDSDALPAAYAARLWELMDSPEHYDALARSSRLDYEQRLNWGSSCLRILDRLDASGRPG